MSKNQYDVECSILKLRIFDNDFLGCELFVSLDSQKKCFYGKIQSKSKTIDFNRSRHLIATIDPSSSQQPIVNLTFLAKKPHVEFFASKDIYYLLTRATSIESNVMESMPVLMKSKSHKNVAEVFLTLIINLSYFSPIRTFPIRAPESRAKPSIFTPDTKFNPSKALSQELSKLSSPKRVKLNYQLSPKQDHTLFDMLSNQVFVETSSSDFDNNSFVASSQVETITEPNQPNRSTHRKHQSSSFKDSNGFEYSSNAERIKPSGENKEDDKVGFSQNQNQNQQVISNLNLNPESTKPQVERIRTPETKNSQSILTDATKPSVRKPVSWRKGKKPDFMKSDKESDADSKLPSLDEPLLNELFPPELNDGKIIRKTDINKQNQTDKSENTEKTDKNEDKSTKDSELDKQNDKPIKIASPILDILNSTPHLSPRLPHLDHPKISINIQPQPTEIKDNTNNGSNQTDQKAEAKEDTANTKDEIENKKDDSEFSFEFDEKKESDTKKDESDRKKSESDSLKDVIEITVESDKKGESDNVKDEVDITIESDKKDENDNVKDEIDITIDSDKKEESDNKKEESESIKQDNLENNEDEKQNSEKKEEKNGGDDDAIIDDFDSDFGNSESSNANKPAEQEGDKSDKSDSKSNEEKKNEEEKKESSDDDDDDDDFF